MTIRTNRQFLANPRHSFMIIANVLMAVAVGFAVYYGISQSKLTLSATQDIFLFQAEFIVAAITSLLVMPPLLLVQWAGAAVLLRR